MGVLIFNKSIPFLGLYILIILGAYLSRRLSGLIGLFSKPPPTVGTNMIKYISNTVSTRCTLKSTY